MGLPKSKIKINWSPEFAYVIGLFATDGNISRDRRHFDFTSKDKELVILFQKCLGLTTKISKKTRAREQEKRYFHTQFGDVNFYKYLLTIGLTPDKSKTIGELKVPQEVFFDFLRGCFDGDGSVYGYWDKRWKHSFMFYITFTSASMKFIKWIRKCLAKLAKVRGHINNTATARAIQLKYAKKEARTLLKEMYYRENLPYLKRKFYKAQEMLSTK